MTTIPTPPPGYATWLDFAVYQVHGVHAADELAALRAERDSLVNLVNAQVKTWTEQVTAIRAECETRRNIDSAQALIIERLTVQRDELLAALEPFAKIEVPANASPGSWVAKTLFCNDMITAIQVQRAAALVARIKEQR